MRMPTVVDEQMRYEAARFQWWRQNVAKCSIDTLSKLTGYSIESIYFMQRGINSTGKSVDPRAWMRFKNACAGALMCKGFDWGQP